MNIYDECNRRLGPQQMNYHFSLSLKNRYFFCEIAKSGCSAVKSELWRVEKSDVPLPKPFLDTRQNVHAPFGQHLLIKPFQVGKDQFNSFVTDPQVIKWAVVRDPFTRALSGYLDKVVRGARQAENIRKRVSLVWGRPLKDILSKTISFEDYCRALKTFKRPVDFDQHWRPQYRHICGDIIRYDHIFKLEELNQKSAQISKTLRLPEMEFSSGSRHATGSSGRLRDYYTPKTADIIREVYREDFENFGYSMDLPA